MSDVLRRVAGLVLLLLCLPMIALLAILVLIFQGRPIFFHQIRSGLGGVPFRMVKFRSMRDLRDANGDLLPDAERTTRIGAFLRRSRLDELPELWNVLTGDLAFIGPRPLLPVTIVELGPRGVKRGKTRPGLTGWAQVNGNTLLTLDEKIALDLWYIEHRNLRRDFMILLATAWVMLGGEKHRQQVGQAPETHA